MSAVLTSNPVLRLRGTDAYNRAMSIAAAELAQDLSKKVVGQTFAVREVAVALTKRLRGLPTGNILMIGNSGSGKTTLMRAVEEVLAKDQATKELSTLVRLHANVLGQEAEQGQPGQFVLRALFDQARRDLGDGATRERLLEHTANGIVFIDEVDKIRGRVGTEPNVRGIRAQESLLTLMENEGVPFEVPEWAGGDRVELDSRGLLFVAAGAFEGLYESVYDRVTIGEDRGALQPVTIVEDGVVKEEIPFRLREWLRSEDLFDYGMSPQFLSRFEALVLFDDLGQKDLAQILLRAPDSGFNAARRYFESCSVELAISPAAVEKIASVAARRKRIGARALREVFRQVIRPYELDPTERAPEGVLMIDVEQVDEALGTGESD